MLTPIKNNKKPNKKKLSKGFYIYPLGGHLEWGRNCTAIRVDSDFVVLDMGIKFCSGGITQRVPPLKKIKKLLTNYNWVGLIISHAHADHCSAVMECKKYFTTDMPEIYGSPVTCNILHKTQRVPLSKLKPLKSGKKITVGKMSISLYPMQHSVPETRAIIIESEYGKFTYMTDFKVDYTPVVGAPTDFTGLKNSDILMIDTTRVSERVTHSESVAYAKLTDALKRGQLNYRKIVCSTYPSQWARLRCVAEFALANNMNYWVVGNTYKIMYTLMVQMNDPATGAPYLSKSEYDHIKFISLNELSQLSDSHGIFMMSGHQRMPQSSLIRIFKGLVKFKIDKQDMVILGSTEIRNICLQPTHAKLKFLIAEKKHGFMLMKDQHVSGHAAASEHIITVKNLKPGVILPTHTSIENYAKYAELVEDYGYTYGHNLFFLTAKFYYKYDPVKHNFMAYGW